MPAVKDGEEVMATLDKLYVFLSGICSQLHTGILGARPNLEMETLWLELEFSSQFRSFF